MAQQGNVRRDERFNEQYKDKRNEFRPEEGRDIKRDGTLGQERQPEIEKPDRDRLRQGDVGRDNRRSA